MGWNSGVDYQQENGWYRPKTASYVGPGDVTSGAIAWGSSAYAYNAAYATGTNPALDLVDQAGANPVTINILATGIIDVASISAWVAAHSVTTIKVKKVYDQTGNSNHWTQGTLGSMPVLTLSLLNGLPGFVSTSAGNSVMVTPSISQATPWTMVAVVNRTGTTTTVSAALAISGVTALLGQAASVNTAYFAGNTSMTAAASDNAFHALIGVLNGASSVLTVDGSDTTGSLSNVAIANTVRLFRDGSGAHSLDGSVMEAGVWGSAISNRTNLNANIHTRYNF